MKPFCFFFLSLFLFCDLTYAEGENAEWFRCSKNNDCLEISIGCAHGVVNKIFEVPAREFYSNLAKRTDCQIASKKENPKEVICQKGQCAVKIRQ
jgi:hypothetical protein